MARAKKQAEKRNGNGADLGFEATLCAATGQPVTTLHLVPPPVTSVFYVQE